MRKCRTRGALVLLLAVITTPARSRLLCIVACHSWEAQRFASAAGYSKAQRRGSLPLDVIVSIISSLPTAQVKCLRHFVASQLPTIHKPQTLICGKLLAKGESLIPDIEEFRIP